MARRTLKLLTLMISLAAASTALAMQPEPMSLLELQRLEFDSRQEVLPTRDAVKPDMRIEAIRDAALQLGIQHGYVYEIERIRERLRQESRYLDGMFDFSALMRFASTGPDELYLLPPVLEEVDEMMAIADNRAQLRTTGHLFRIVKEERLVTSPPDWREYLLFDRQYELSRPPALLLPKNEKERSIWSAAVQKGWFAGKGQAHREMVYRVRELGRDYLGMLRYLRLVKEGKLYRTEVASTHQQVTGNARELKLNQRVYTIGKRARFNFNTDNWRGFNLDNRGSYRYPDEPITWGRDYGE